MLLPKQIWRDIPEYEGKYQVSNTGKVRSLNYMRTGKVKVMKQNSNNNGYSMVSLSKDGKGKTYLVHRLVALAFIPNPSNYPIINHKDENPSNNNVNNLEWCTYEYNNTYGTRLERQIIANKGRKITVEHKQKISKPVIMLSKDGKPIAVFKSRLEANQYLGKHKYSGDINECIKGKINTCAGYKWKNIESEVI